jgi:hypothetical protein
VDYEMTLKLEHKKMTKEESLLARKRPNIVHWEKGGCVFLFIGKCANSSIKAGILEAEGGINPDVALHLDPRLKYVDRAFVRDTDLPVICVVRRPYDRLMSFWRNKVAGMSPKEFHYDRSISGVYADMPFRVFLERVITLPDSQLTDNHVVPATKVLQCVNPMTYCAIIQYEHLINPDGKMWEYLRLATGAYLPKTMPHVNGSDVPKPVMPAHAAMRLRQRVFEKYRADYDRWGWDI